MVSDDRGQVLLVGAVVLAMTLVAIVLLLNGMAYTEHVGDGDQHAFGDAKRVEHSVSKDLDAMTASLADGSASAPEAEIRAATDGYGIRFSEMTSSTQAATVDIEFDSAASEGTAIIHDDPGGQFVSNQGATGSSWQPIMGSERSRIESYDLSMRTATIPQTPASPTGSFRSFGIELTEHGSPTSTWTLSVERLTSSDVRIFIDGSLACSFSAGSTVDIDIIAGEVKNQSCSFTSPIDPSEDYSLTYLGAGPYTGGGPNWNYPQGEYKIVLDTPGAVPSSNPNRYDDPGAPTVQTEVTTATFRFTFDTPTMTYESTIEVEVDDS